jgi:hypothetical protein
MKYLPSIWWWSISIRKVSETDATISIPLNWRTQNPFQSIYFAALGGAAELSTGILASLHCRGKGKISMLITAMHAEYIKKATDTIVFTCDSGSEIRETIEKTILLKQAHTVTTKSVGTLPNGEIVAVMHFTWSFRLKN